VLPSCYFLTGRTLLSQHDKRHRGGSLGSVTHNNRMQATAGVLGAASVATGVRPPR